MARIIDFGMGPLFIFSVSIMILGLLRLFIITVLNIRNVTKNAGDKNFKYLSVLKSTITWMIPGKNIWNTQIFFSTISIIFHIGLILVPIFLFEHILIWKKIFGFGWPAFSEIIVDTLTIITIICTLILIAYRIFSKFRRNLSSGGDYFFLLLILIIFLSGYLIPRKFNPFGYEITLMIHIIAGNFAMIIFPFTRLAHCVLFPLMRLSSSVAWHFPGNAGREMNKILYGQENKKI